jgi:hypothetical protein
MPASNPSAPTGSTPEQQQPDIQQLVALLGNLMPLLLRFQSQTVLQAPMGTGHILGPGNLPLPDPMLDHQAAVNLAGDVTASLLRNLSAYLEIHAARHPGLENCIPIVTQAARWFAARDYAQALNLIWQAYRVIAMVRAANPHLPPLQAGGPVAVSPSDPTTPSIH